MSAIPVLAQWGLGVGLSGSATMVFAAWTQRKSRAERERDAVPWWADGFHGYVEDHVITSTGPVPLDWCQGCATVQPRRRMTWVRDGTLYRCLDCCEQRIPNVDDPEPDPEMEDWGSSSPRGH